jgi:hypothetical protein
LMMLKKRTVDSVNDFLMLSTSSGAVSVSKVSILKYRFQRRNSKGTAGSGTLYRSGLQLNDDNLVDIVIIYIGSNP